MNDFCLLGDSCIDFDMQEIKDKDIRLIPINTVLDGVEYGINKESISLDKFYELVKEGKKHTTVAANPLTYEEYFREVLEAGKDILYIGFSSGLSSSFANASIACENLREEFPDRRIEIVDTLAGSIEESLILDMAYKLKVKGLDMIEIKKILEEKIPYIWVEFVVDDLMYLQKGGRLSKGKAIIGQAMKIAPILVTDKDGKITQYKNVRGRKKAIAKVLKDIEENIDTSICDEVYLSYSSNRQEAEIIKEELEDLGISKVNLYEMSLTIGAHTGPDTIVFAYASKKERE